MDPVWRSWPSLRHVAGEQAGQLQLQNADQQSLLTYEQLRTWLHALNINDDGQLIISSDSLRLLPAQLPYELLGPLVLAAVDGLIANSQQQTKHINQQQGCAAVQRKLALQDSSRPAAQDKEHDQQPHQQQQGLQLVGIDLQQPVAAPLTTCMAAYSCLQQLSLQELNIDVCAAKALGSILHSGSSSFSSNGCSTGAAGCSLRSLTMDAVFMCDMAWQSLCEGLAAGCELQTIRLLNCLQPSSLPALAAALAGGCQQLRELDVSHNSLGCAQGESSSMQSDGSSSSSKALAAVDTAWSSLMEALQTCTQLQALSAVRCSLGPKAACAVVKLLRAKERDLRQLNLGQCSKMGTDALSQLVAAAASCCSLQQLDLSSTGLNNAVLKSLTQCSSSSWISRGPAAGRRGLRRLAIGGNCWVSGAAVQQLGRAMAAGGHLGGLTKLSLAGCASVGDEGAVLLAAALAAGGGSLCSLDMSGCELTDAAATALAALLAAAPAAKAPAPAPAGFCSPLKWRAAAAAAVPAEERVQLQELRLVDNQITSAGIQALAKAVSSPSCRLQLLDVSFNWVGPQGMQPLVEAAAAANKLGPAAADTNEQDPHQQHTLQVLRECLPEYWRVEAAKQAAVQALAAEAGVDAAAAAVHTSSQHSSSLAADARSLADSSSCSGSCCCQPGTTGNKALSDGNYAGRCTAIEPELGAAPDKQQLWMFNTLFCHEGGLSRASSAIATGAYGGSDDICNHYDDSDDALSDVDSSECSAVVAGASSRSGGSPALLSSDNSYGAALSGVEAAPWMLAPTSSRVSLEKGCKKQTAGAGVSAAGSVASVGAESSSGIMEDAPAALPGHSKPVSTPDHHADDLHTTVTFGVGPGSPKIDQARASSGGDATSAALAAAQAAAQAAIAAAAAQPGSPSTKLVPRPPVMSSSRQGSGSNSGAGLDWSGVSGASPTPGLKTLRTMRRRVSEPAVVGSLRTAATGPAAAAGATPAAGSRSPARATGGAATSKLPHHRLRSVIMSDAANVGASMLQHINVPSSTLVAERSVNSCGIGDSGGGRNAGSPAGGVSSDSCALRDCAPMPGRRSALPRVSS